MSITKKLGKDTVIFATKEDHADSSKIILPEPEPPAGAILPNGEINWDCPCLGGVASGPCGIEFREAFSCFVHSTIEPKGSECVDAFTTMQACMVNYPELYGNKNTNMNEDDKDDPTKEIDEKKIVTNSNETGNELNTSIRNGSVAINRDVLTES